jgi:hypothetical protein
VVLRRDDSGQLYTIEGIIASAILLSVLLFVIQANSIVVPQTEKIADMKLQQHANDILTCIDISNGSQAYVINGNVSSDLKTYVETWNGSQPNANSYIASAEMPKLWSLHQYINSSLPTDVHYSLTITYTNVSSPTKITTKTLISEGQPVDNSVTATRIITLNYNDKLLSNFWKTDANQYPKVIAVKITCWYV